MIKATILPCLGGHFHRELRLAIPRLADYANNRIKRAIKAHNELITGRVVAAKVFDNFT